MALRRPRVEDRHLGQVLGFPMHPRSSSISRTHTQLDTTVAPRTRHLVVPRVVPRQRLTGGGCWAASDGCRTVPLACAHMDMSGDDFMLCFP